MVEDNQNEARETESDGGLSEEEEPWPKEQAVTVDQDKGESCTQSESMIYEVPCMVYMYNVYLGPKCQIYDHYLQFFCYTVQL